MRSGPPQIEETTEWACTICGTSTLSRSGIIQHLASTEDSSHDFDAIIETPDRHEGRGYCGKCGKESTLSGLADHCRDTFGHPTDLPHIVIRSDDDATSEFPLTYIHTYHCPKCDTTVEDAAVLSDHDCVSFQSAAETVRQSAVQDSETESELPVDHPDLVANTLLRNEDEPVRVYLTDSEITVPTEPYQNGRPTTTVPAASFDAKVRRIHNEDEGLSLMGTLHLPAQEWERLGLQQHWNAENAETAGQERYLEIWASRHETMDSYDQEMYKPPASLDDDAPVLEPYREYADKERVPESPIAPFPPIKLELHVAHAEAADWDTHGFDRLEVGRIRRVKPLPELSQQPEKRNERRDSPDSQLPSPPSRHPSIDYGELDPLPATDEILDALYTVNRVAKRHDEQGDQAYRAGDGATAKVHSVKKHALYDLKTVALHRLAVRNPDSLTISRHEIDGHDHWLFDFGERSFHQPVEAVAEDLLDDFGLDTDGAAESIEYDPDPGSRDLPMSIENALGVFARFDLDANDFLSQTTVADYTWNVEQYTGWNIR